MQCMYRVKRIPMLKERKEHSVREPWSSEINLGTVECEKTDGLAVISQIAFAVFVWDVPTMLSIIRAKEAFMEIRQAWC